MTDKRTIFFFWVLFLVPAVIVAVPAFRLLLHEQERLDRLALAALSRQATTAADTIHVTVQAVQDTMAQSLLQIPADRYRATLTAWAATNPLVRNVFIQDPDHKLLYPAKGMEATAEERRFKARYEALFSGRLAFDYNDMGPGDRSAPKEARTRALDKEAVSGPVAVIPLDGKKFPTARRTLVNLSRPSQQDQVAQVPSSPATYGKVPSPEAPVAPKTGWIPWFSENRLFILVWARQDGIVYGLELELMTLLSRLVVDFPGPAREDAALVLMDGNGHPLHQTGDLDIPARAVPAVQVDVSFLLPHWKIALYTGEQKIGTGRDFLMLAGILSGIFVAAMLSGGILLTRAALKNMEDARRKTSFVASVSHELKTPLTTLRMYAELLQSGRITAPEKRKHYLSVMVEETRRLSRLINNMLDFGRLEQGKKKYHKEKIDLAALLTQIIDAHTIRIRNQGLEIIARIGPEEPEVRGNPKDSGMAKAPDFTIISDPDALEQVVLNLMDNALKYAGKGRFIAFILAWDRPGTSSDASIGLSVCDDGPGIPKAHRDAVFEKFHRVDNALTSTHPGSGLGLSISRKIMRDLGGDLVLSRTSTGTGCCFTARIKPT